MTEVPSLKIYCDDLRIGDMYVDIEDDVCVVMSDVKFSRSRGGGLFKEWTIFSTKYQRFKTHAAGHMETEVIWRR